MSGFGSIKVEQIRFEREKMATAERTYCNLHGYRIYEGTCSLCAGTSNREFKGVLASWAGTSNQAKAPIAGFLLPKFVEAMNDIGRYGHEKYGELSFHARAEKGDSTRGDHPRTAPEAIAEHARAHFQMHVDGVLHDHFHTRRHQLAAVAFNAMMEYYFAGLDTEK